MTIKFFTKMELAFKPEHADGTTDTKPRIISSASPFYNCIVGPYVAAVQLLIKRSHHKAILVGEHMRERIGAWFGRHVLWRALECDFSTFDATQSHALRCVILRLWQRFHGMPEDVARLMFKRAETKRGYGVHGTKITVNGTMASGDPDTYIGNTVLNVLVQTYAYCTTTGQSIQEAILNFTIIAAGDDSLSFDRTRAADAAGMERVLLELGMSAKFVQHNDPAASLVSFCSSYFIPVGRQWFLSPKPGRILAKLPWVSGPPSRASLQQLRANALGVWCSVQFTPLAREYIAHILNLTRDHRSELAGERHTFDAELHSMWNRLGPLDEDTALWFEQHYYINQTEYAEAVARIRSLRLGQQATVPHLNNLWQVDLERDE